MGKNKTLAPIKKQYIKALLEKGDPRSYNEIQADFELELWEQRFKGNFEVGPNTPEQDVMDKLELAMEQSQIK